VTTAATAATIDEWTQDWQTMTAGIALSEHQRQRAIAALERMAAVDEAWAMTRGHNSRTEHSRQLCRRKDLRLLLLSLTGRGE